ncbi:MAG TPA: hypothetical protein VGL89_02800 [Candidatus Koribacter sp.]
MGAAQHFDLASNYHLAQARLDIREGRIETDRQHAAEAATLIEQTGYHRRDAVPPQP